MSLLEVVESYRDDVEFLMVYVREAHPTDKWWLAETKLMRLVMESANPYPSYDLAEPETIEERNAAAIAARDKLLGDLPVLVDGMDNAVDLAYVAWPTRVYLIDEEGRVRYDSGLGPYGLSPETLDAELAAYLGGS